MAKRIPQEDKEILYKLVKEDIRDHIGYVSSYLGQTPEYVLSNHRDINFSEIQNLPSLSGHQELSDLLGCSTGPIENITKKLESDLKNYRTFVLKSEARTGKTHSEDTIRKISGPNHHMYGRIGKDNPNHGKPLSEEHRRKIAQTQTGKTHSEESKRKMSQAYLERMREFGDFIIPNFNPFACHLIDAYGIENGYNFIHALSLATEIQVTDKVRRNVPVENGQGIGECHIKITDEDGNVIDERWVDGYDPEKNVVIEFYEQAHNRNEEKDKIRQNTIRDFLGCEFIVLREGSDEVRNLESKLMVI